MTRSLEGDYLDPHHVGQNDEDYTTGFEPTSLDRPRYEPTAERPCYGGVQRIYAFPNGYSASVIRHPYSYGWEQGLWELGVKVQGLSENPFDATLTYDTPITDDVIGRLTEDGVQEILARIEALPRRER